MTMTMIRREYTLRFLTPAFLGNADQSGEWRTPPFKALLRQWWRVAVAAEEGFNVDAIRRLEGDLFGVAADKDGESRQSRIRIRLNRWNTGRLASWDGLDNQRVTHREVKSPVGAHLYLGYGPLTYAPGGTALKRSAAIQHGEEANFSLALPVEHEHAVTTALWLMDRYGTVGGRSRNGWGSFLLTPSNADTPKLTCQCDSTLTRRWQQALALDWPHAIGSADGKPLIWQTAPATDWRVVMRKLAEIKIGLRTQFMFPNAAPPHPAPLDRHWLSYPVTKHGVRSWDRNARLPNSLRFKVREGEDGKMRGVIFHVPCKPSIQFNPDPNAIESVWQRVHSFLNAPSQNLTSISA